MYERRRKVTFLFCVILVEKNCGMCVCLNAIMANNFINFLGMERCINFWYISHC